MTTILWPFDGYDIYTNLYMISSSASMETFPHLVWCELAPLGLIANTGIEPNLQNYQILWGMVNIRTPVFFNNNDILDPHAKFTGNINTGLCRNN